MDNWKALEDKQTLLQNEDLVEQFRLLLREPEWRENIQGSLVNRVAKQTDKEEWACETALALIAAWPLQRKLLRKLMLLVGFHPFSAKIEACLSKLIPVTVININHKDSNEWATLKVCCTELLRKEFSIMILRGLARCPRWFWSIDDTVDALAVEAKRNSSNSGSTTQHVLSSLCTLLSSVVSPPFANNLWQRMRQEYADMKLSPFRKEPTHTGIHHLPNIFIRSTPQNGMISQQTISDVVSTVLQKGFDDESFVQILRLLQGSSPALRCKLLHAIAHMGMSGISFQLHFQSFRSILISICLGEDYGVSSLAEAMEAQSAAFQYLSQWYTAAVENKNSLRLAEDLLGVTVNSKLENFFTKAIEQGSTRSNLAPYFLWVVQENWTARGESADETWGKVDEQILENGLAIHGIFVGTDRCVQINTRQEHPLTSLRLWRLFLEIAISRSMARSTAGIPKISFLPTDDDDSVASGDCLETRGAFYGISCDVRIKYCLKCEGNSSSFTSQIVEELQTGLLIERYETSQAIRKRQRNPSTTNQTCTGSTAMQFCGKKATSWLLWYLERHSEQHENPLRLEIVSQLIKVIHLGITDASDFPWLFRQVEDIGHLNCPCKLCSKICLEEQFLIAHLVSLSNEFERELEKSLRQLKATIPSTFGWFAARAKLSNHFGRLLCSVINTIGMLRTASEAVEMEVCRKVLAGMLKRQDLLTQTVNSSTGAKLWKAVLLVCEDWLQFHCTNDGDLSFVTVRKVVHILVGCSGDGAADMSFPLLRITTVGSLIDCTISQLQNNEFHAARFNIILQIATSLIKLRERSSDNAELNQLLLDLLISTSVCTTFVLQLAKNPENRNPALAYLDKTLKSGGERNGSGQAKKQREELYRIFEDSKQVHHGLKI